MKVREHKGIWECRSMYEPIKGTLITRYKRFLADVRLENGEVLTAHCPNSGSMKGCAEPGSAVIVSDSQNPKRKLRHTLELIKVGGSWVGVNTSQPNRIVYELAVAGAFPELGAYDTFRREVKYGAEGRSRIDLYCQAEDASDCYVEIKNVTLREGSYAAFPDAVTSRGQKHLQELMDVVDSGQRAIMFFFVGRDDCKVFRPAHEIDPEYAKLLEQAASVGVELIAQQFRYTQSGVKVLKRLDVELGEL